MNRNIYPLIVAVSLLTSCNTKYNFKRYDNGLCYHIQHEGDGELIQQGQTVKLRLKQVYRDSVLRDMTDSLQFYQLQDSIQLSKAPFAIFGKVTKGDSIVFKALTDSVFKDKMPPFARRNEWLYTHVFIEEIFYQGEDYRDDMKREMRKRNIPVPD